MTEALVYQKLSSNQVRCLVCQRKCLIADGQTGFCQTKLNQKGRLISLNYGILSGPPQADPIEKKPFYHFLPGTLTFSIGSYGCNFRCKQCLNWWCSWGEPAATILKKAPQNHQPPQSPQRLISQAKKTGYQSIAFTYNEPAVWVEFVLACAKLAKKAGLSTLFVTNGSWTKETLDKIGPYIDAANIDFKGFSDKTYAKMGGFFGSIPEMAEYAQKKYGIFLEITTLLIPTVNDHVSELQLMTHWLVKHLGHKTPWHLSRFDPAAAPDEHFRQIPPTPIEKLQQAKKIGQKTGIQFIYIWAPGNDLPEGVYTEGNTYCPKCKNLAVQRTFWKPEILGVSNKGHCQKCEEDLNIRFRQP